MDKQMGYCRECKGKGSYKLPGTKNYKLCAECGGSGQAEIDIEAERVARICPPSKGKKDINTDKIGNIWIK